ncbi:hypothetical protein FRB91_010340 [Serendipita sp. 411]|nr:hypothetical protein FRC19_000808 [Serendipita sp. 401]KAG8858123.1 hypothetical protein FRB91_010340 [Serendipita sp. 411]KAG9055855.1 hypothetical protein FS842_000981 [Serendipita sp. 407]
MNSPQPSGSKRPRAPTVPPMPSGESPQINAKAIKDICGKAEAKILKMSSAFELHHGRMPDERTLTETLAYKLGKSAGKISFHTQAEEGVSGTDLLIQMTLVGGVADEHASGSGKAAAPATELIVILQAKSYHKNPDKEKEHTEDYKKEKKPQKGEPERVAGFTYKGGSSGDNRKLQMHLLKDYADEVKKQNAHAEVIAGYIVYSGEGKEDHEYGKGIAWIPVSDLIEECKKFNKGEDCTQSDRVLDKELSREFMELELKKKDNGISKCFLEDVLHDHLDSSV